MRANGCEGLSEAIAVLAGLDLTGLPDQLGGLCVSELQTLLGGVVPVLTRLGGVHSAVLGELTVRSGGTVPSAPLPNTPQVPGPSVAVAHWLRDLTGTTGTTAGSAVRRSGLLRQLPLVLAAVVAGELGTAQAGVLTRLVGALPAQALAEAEPALIEVARGMDPTALGAYVAFLIATWVEPVFEADQRSQEAKRFLTTRREADGMLSGRFRLTTGDSEALLTALEPLARRNALADQRDAGQRRADALVEMCQQILAFGDLPEAGGFRPRAQLRRPGRLGRRAPPGLHLRRARRCQPGPHPPARRPHQHHRDQHRPRQRNRQCRGRPAAGDRLLRQRRLDRTTDPRPDRDAAVRRPDHPGPAPTPRAGREPADPDRPGHQSPTPSPGRPRPRLHPPTSVLRRPPPPAPRARQLHPPGQPRQS